MSRRAFALTSVLVVFILLLTSSSCQVPPTQVAGPAEPIAAAPSIDPDAKVEIWIDAAREEEAGRFSEKYPDKGALVGLTTTAYTELPQKILFWNNVGGGWVDGSFGVPSIVPLINSAAHSYLGDLTPWVSQEIIDGFTPGSLQACMDEGKLYCLRNDLAFYVLYYNAPLLEEWGYTIPQTYEEMMLQGQKAAQEHPDYQYLVSSFPFFLQMLVSNKCPAQQILGPGQVRINATHENCVKAARWLDQMIANESVLVTNMMAAETVKMIQEGRWLFMPAASWWAEGVMMGTYFQKDDPKVQGTIGVAPMPKWEGQDQNWVYWWGGAAWVMSRHTENPQLVADFITYMTTEAIVTEENFPAYGPAADKWLERMPQRTFYADPMKAGQIFKQESAKMWTMFAEAPVEIWPVSAPIRARVYANELTYEQSLTELQNVLVDGARKLGYEPITDGLSDFPTE